MLRLDDSYPPTHPSLGLVRGQESTRGQPGRGLDAIRCGTDDVARPVRRAGMPSSAGIPAVAVPRYRQRGQAAVMPRASVREPGGAAILRHRFFRPGWVDRAKPCRKTGRRAELPPGQGVSAMRPVRPRRVRRTRCGGAWLASQGRFAFGRGVALTRAIDMNFAFYRRSADVPARRCSKRSASGCGHRFCSSRSLPPQQSFEAEVVDARVSAHVGGRSSAVRRFSARRVLAGRFSQLADGSPA